MVMTEDETLNSRRLKDAKSARALWVKFRKDSQERRDKWVRVQNQLDGAPPFLQSDLVKNGQGWRCNVNFRDASSTLEQVLVGYWRLLHDSANLAAVEVQGDDPKAQRWTDLFQDAFNRFVEDWGPDYVHQYLQFSQNHVGFGVGVPYFPDDQSPRWESVRVGEFECPSRTKTSVESISVFQVRGTYEIEDLWKRVRTPALRNSSTNLGWDVSAIDRLLAEEMKSESSPAGVDSDDVLEMQRLLRDDALGATAGRAPIGVIHTFVRDYDDKITHTVCAEDSVDPAPLFDNFNKTNRHESMAQVVAPVFFDAGNGDFWGTKGFGVKNHEIAATSNRLKSRAVDRTVIDGLNCVDKRENANEVPAVASIGPFNFLPPGVEQLANYPTGRAVLETVELLDSQFNQNNARYRDNGRQIAETGTAKQADLLANIQSQVDVANATLYLHQVARNIFTEQFRRLRKSGNTSPDAKLFFTRCVTIGGMPKETFHDIEIVVRTGSDPGAANLAVRGEKALQLMSLPDANRRFAQETWVSANFGSTSVNSALRPLDSLEDKTAQRLALLENNAMGESVPMPVDPQDKHEEHAPVHLQPMKAIVNAYDKTGQVDPTALSALQFLIPHLEEHMGYMKDDKLAKDLYVKVWPEFTAVRSAAEGMFRMAEKLSNAQGAQPLAGAVGATSPQ